MEKEELSLFIIKRMNNVLYQSLPLRNLFQNWKVLLVSAAHELTSFLVFFFQSFFFFRENAQLIIYNTL